MMEEMSCAARLDLRYHSLPPYESAQKRAGVVKFGEWTTQRVSLIKHVDSGVCGSGRLHHSSNPRTVSSVAIGGEFRRPRHRFEAIFMIIIVYCLAVGR